MPSNMRLGFGCFLAYNALAYFSKFTKLRPKKFYTISPLASDIVDTIQSRYFHTFP